MFESQGASEAEEMGRETFWLVLAPAKMEGLILERWKGKEGGQEDSANKLRPKEMWGSCSMVLSNLRELSLREGRKKDVVG